MEDSKKHKKRARGMKAEAKGLEETLAEPMAGYTPEQREVYLVGVRILTRVAVRVHMRRQSSRIGAAPGPPTEGESGE